MYDLSYTGLLGLSRPYRGLYRAYLAESGETILGWYDHNNSTSTLQ